MTINYVRRGDGPPLVMLHGLGGNLRSWDPIGEALEGHFTCYRLDLPGHGASPLPDPVNFSGVTAAVAAWVEEQGLQGAACMGMSLGGRVALELVRQGVLGPCVALAPGGFWAGGERGYIGSTLPLAVGLARTLAPMLPALAANPASRAAMLLQFSALPMSAPAEPVARELLSVASTPSVESLIADMALGPMQAGAVDAPVTLVWGREDGVCLPQQAARALEAFPGARLEWLQPCGHYAIWDQPDAVVAIILDALATH